jgi:hypothetical protein
LPLRIFSGKEHPSASSAGIFFCYSLPAQEYDGGGWTLEAGYTRWLYFDLVSEKILEEVGTIVEAIRSTPDTPRSRSLPPARLSEVRGEVDNYLKNTYLKRVGAPIGVAPVLKAWMELS